MQVNQLLPVQILDLLVVGRINLNQSTVILLFIKRSSVEPGDIVRRRKDLNLMKLGYMKHFSRSLLLFLLTLLERLMSVT